MDFFLDLYTVHIYEWYKSQEEIVILTTLFYKNKPHVGVRLGVINDICYVFSMSVVVVRCEHSVRMGWPVI